MTAAVYVGRHRKPDPEDTVQIPPVQEPPAWPTEEDLTVWRRFVRRLRLVRWSGTRVTAVVSSGMVLGSSGAMWLVTQ